MNFEFMTIDTPLPPCMPFPRALTGFPVSSTAKVMYCRMLDAMLSKGQEDENGILFVCFPVTAIAAVLSRSSMTVKCCNSNKEKTQKCNTNVYCPKFNHQFFCYFLFRNTVFLVFTLNIIYGRFLLYIL